MFYLTPLQMTYFVNSHTCCVSHGLVRAQSNQAHLTYFNTINITLYSGLLGWTSNANKKQTNLQSNLWVTQGENLLHFLNTPLGYSSTGAMCKWSLLSCWCQKSLNSASLCNCVCSCVIHIIHSLVLLNTFASVLTGVGQQSSTVFWNWLSILFSLLALTSQGSLGL